jgi:hypothetical protein
MPETGEFCSGVKETLELGGIRVIWLFQVGVFT